MHRINPTPNHCTFNLVDWSTSSTVAHFAMAACMDVPVEKEIAAATAEGRPISASNKKTVSNKNTASKKKNSIDTTSSFR
jgi:hypothetical protein